MRSATNTVWPLATLALLLSVVLPSTTAQAQTTTAAMSPEEMIALARPAVGHGYHWYHGNWTLDGSNVGECTPIAPATGCGDSALPNAHSCNYQGMVGADCSGFVAKVWQVPEPTPVEDDVHPYGTEAFGRESGGPWTDITEAEVKRGDAFVKGGSHVVFVDRRIANGKYMIYHASGCTKGIVYQQWDPPVGFKPIRRDNVTDPDVKDCSGKGTFATDNTCHCDSATHTAGDNCERCLPGFVKYPACTSANCGLHRASGSTLQGVLNCGSEFTFKLVGGGNNNTEYGCGPSPLKAEEVGFQFRPPEG
jgi:hypothetical protein